MASLSQRNGVLGHQLAAHLLKRCTYGPNIERIDEFSVLTADQAVDLLVDGTFDFELDEPIHHITNDFFIRSGDWSLISPDENTTIRRNQIIAWWLERAASDTTIASKMEFFLHSIFVTSHMLDDRYYFDHLSLIIWSARGNFKSFSYKMSLDNIMLAYLNNEENTKESPNENYAREFFELFTIGKGAQAGPQDYTNYTEYDIQQAARVLTGFNRTNNGSRSKPYRLDPDTGIWRGKPTFSKHDTGDKIFSNRFQGRVITGAVDSADMWRELQDLVDMTFDQRATAALLARRLYVYFVGKDITSKLKMISWIHSRMK